MRQSDAAVRRLPDAGVIRAAVIHGLALGNKQSIINLGRAGSKADYATQSLLFILLPSWRLG
jgi:hypothetical protein